MRAGAMLIRADADGAIGAGHVMRCLALAYAWQSAGGSVTFLGRCASLGLIDRIRLSGVGFLPLAASHPHPSDAESTIQHFHSLTGLDPAAADWLVLDGYNFDPEYHRVMKDRVPRVLTLDDTADLPEYAADVVLNQNIHAERLHYPNAPGVHLLLGTGYALLRPEFLRQDGVSRLPGGSPQRVLVTLGGADPDNVTRNVLEALSLIDAPRLEVRVVVGPANPHLDALREIAASLAHEVELHCSVTDMPGMMRWADLAVSAGGSTCWELAYMGLPGLVIVLADNQRGIAAGLDEEGAAVSLGWHADLTPQAIATALRGLLDDSPACERLAHRGRTLVDGRGGERVVRELLKCQ